MNRLTGLGVGPFVLPSQNPNSTSVPLNQLQDLISDAAQYATWIRTFGTYQTLQQAGLYIHQAGAKAMIGSYLANPSDPNNGAANQIANQQELDRLIAVANAGQADIVTVGNETLYTGTLTPDQLLGYISYVRQRVPASVMVATVDTWKSLVDNPDVMLAGDIILPTIYPFYEQAPESNALATLQQDYAQIQAASGGKPIMIAETGWPSSGSIPSPGSPSIPSAANQFDYFMTVQQWARENGIAIIWFEAFSEPWKASANDYSSWGLTDVNYVFDSSLAGAFE